MRQVVLEARYDPCVTQTPETADPNMATSREMIGVSAAYLAGYTGGGSRIAVIDTGLDMDHQSFDAGAFDESLKQLEQSYDLLDAEEIARVLPELNVLSRSSHVTAAELYKTTKVPFGYNYVDQSASYIDHNQDQAGEHGSHVAGIATANALIPAQDGYVSALDSVFVQGVAPDAQLVVMKVFGISGGAYDSDYMAAIEDAILLGCDSINLSLGSAAPGLYPQPGLPGSAGSAHRERCHRGHFGGQLRPLGRAGCHGRPRLSVYRGCEYAHRRLPRHLSQRADRGLCG